MKVSELFNKSFERIESLFKPKVSTTKRCCLHIQPDQIHALLAHQTKDEFELLAARTIAFTSLDQLPLILVGLSNQFHLSETPTTWLLSLKDYEIIMIDAMPVPEHEMIDALKWRLKTSISYDINDAAIDYFKIPGKRSDPNQPFIAAVSARKKDLQEVIDIIKNSDIYINSIDIPELAIQRLTSIFENNEKSHAFVYCEGNLVTLNITSEKTLYFTRQIELKPEPGNKDKLDYKDLCLEILRYFDYYQSQWRRPSPHKMYLAAAQDIHEELQGILSEQLFIHTSIYPLTDLNLVTKDNKRLKDSFLLAYGCMCPTEEANAATN